MKKLKVSWFSAGVSSFIATYLVKDSVDKIIYIDIPNQHKDSMRFVKDCEKVLGKTIEIISSGKSVEEAILQYGLIRLVKGFAPCTKLLKKEVRKNWEKEYGNNNDITYVWGLDCNEKNRKFGIIDATPEYKHEFPLIENDLTKQDCHAMCERLGIKRPQMYDLGYNNNNCIGCVKGGMGYWNKIRIDFPEVFENMKNLERKLGHSCINGVFLDELDPKRGNIQNEVMQDCSIMCEIALRSNDN